MIPLKTSLDENSGIGQKFLGKLKKLGIKTVKDLLWHFPTRYEDFSEIYKIADLVPNQEATIQGTINEIKGRRSFRRRLFILEALISDETGSIRAVWFNQPYIQNVLKQGKLANFSGKVSNSKEGELYLSNPTYELLTTHYKLHTPTHTARLVPIYPETKGLTSRGLRYLIKPLLEKIGKIDEIIPQAILTKENFPNINSAVNQIHFPETLEKALDARKRFDFEDLFIFQLYTLTERLKLAKEKSQPINIEIEEIKKILSQLPFELTMSQKKSLWEILQDLKKSHPMNRLLQGDVGSGKTIIAAISAIATVNNGFQTAFMAPTEILARQHYQTFLKFFPEYENGVALLISKEAKIFLGPDLETTVKKEDLKKQIANGKIKVIIGTHALIQKAVSFANLALVIVDEQHRFGVEQRRALLRQSSPSSSLIPHFLSMTATPIPRTLSLTLFGDLDLSLISELPRNRKPIITKIVAPENRNKAYAFIRGEVKKGRQAFVICPRIEITNSHESATNITNTKNIREISEKFVQISDVKTVTQEYEKLSKKIFPDLKIAMLHGKLSARGGSAFGGKTKEGVMKDFTDGKTDILVSTSVIEVGVDIPNATIMMIESSERFGLAQLYQFRGRVGRGEHQSFCFLFTESPAKTVEERLKSIVEAKNGFELAEKDLKLRGPGELLGQIQTGRPDLAMKALQHPNLVKTARESALAILKIDPALKRYPLLKEKLRELKKETHWE